MRNKARLLYLVAAFAIGITPFVPSAHAAKPKPEWNQVSNVKDAAKRLGTLHRQKGAEAALKFLEACYKTHTLAEKYTAGLESCMAQDYMLSQVLAVIYSKVPKEALGKMKAPSADVIARSMQGRFQAIFQQYKFTQDQADSLRKAVDTHGMPIFVKAVFPKRRGDAGAADGKAGKDPGANGAPRDLAPPVPPLPERAPAQDTAPGGDGK